MEIFLILPFLTFLLSLTSLAMGIILEYVKTAFYNISRTHEESYMSETSRLKVFNILSKCSYLIIHVELVLTFHRFLVCCCLVGFFWFFGCGGFFCFLCFLCVFSSPFALDWMMGEPTLFYTYTRPHVFSVKHETETH